MQFDQIKREIFNAPKDDRLNIALHYLEQFFPDETLLSKLILNFNLTPAEANFLALLISRKGRIVSYDTLFSATARHDSDAFIETIKFRASAIRRKIKACNIGEIVNVRQCGYLFRANPSLKNFADFI